MKASTIAISAAWLSLLGCTPSEREGGGGEPELPSITVTLEQPSELRTTSSAVQAVPAPDIQLLALLRPDRNHLVPVPASRTGVLIRVQPERHTHHGDTLAVLGLGSQIAGREVPILGGEDGTWLPLRRQTQFVLQEDTIGVVEKHGNWLALGTITDLEARLIHQGDPVALRLAANNPGVRRSAKVEWVRKSADSPYSADIAIEFPAAEGTFDSLPGPVTVTVASRDPEDSLAAVPPSAVVQLPLGSAVFVPLGGARYEVRWVLTGPSLNGLIVVREGVTSGMSIVVQGLGPLVEAAQDSLSARSGRRGQATP